MKEEDIRTNESVRKAQTLFQQDLEEFIYPNEFVEVACPACNSKNYRKAYSKLDFDFVLCNLCKTLFVNPRPGFDVLSKYYENSKELEFWKNEIFFQTENARNKLIFQPRVDNVLEICKKYGCARDLLVEVGAGFGNFCEKINELGWFKKVIAIEPNPHLAKKCRERGLDVLPLSVENAKIENSADVVVSFEVIEHLFNPGDFILKCLKLLKKDGLLILTTPNIFGFDLLVLQEESDNICAPKHLNYFNPRSLKYLLVTTGFDVLEYITPGELDVELVHKKVISKKIDISKDNFLKYLFFDASDKQRQSFQKYLAENGLSSHMWMIARRKSIDAHTKKRWSEENE